MFRNIAEEIVLCLSKKKVLKQNNKEIYVYALEVISLNFTLLITLLMVSLAFKELLFFVCYVCFYIPLRVFSGGYHSKRSETCFIMSVVSYVILMIILNNIIIFFNSTIMILIVIIVMLALFCLSPVENCNHPLLDEQKKRNKIIVRIIVCIDFTLLIVFYVNRMSIISYVVIFILLNGLTFGIGKIENYIVSRKHVENLE